ncbi:hypothetical protein GOB93_01050 [Acetobacter musti]|mgnify:CR=1 FL=1|uniref:Uncharacterized protein n=1 Tax=Acetobacter musti TaxID=864732 RepID=A0ABX0JNL3_9PROT|nr:hypothetical protein [Acetobacter musti]NHN83229.1 hypothetical protein [Acetobacter musti]
MSEYRIEEIRDESGRTVRWEIYHEDELIRSFTDKAGAEAELEKLQKKETFSQE